MSYKTTLQTHNIRLQENGTKLAQAIEKANALPDAGGSSGGTSGIYMAKITPASDMESLQVTHNLATTDILAAICWAETLGNVTPTFNGALGKFWTKTDIPNNRVGFGFSTHALYNTPSSVAWVGAPLSSAYWDAVVDENTFSFRRAGASAAKYIAGVTYTVIIMAASAFSVTEV